MRPRIPAGREERNQLDRLLGLIVDPGEQADPVKVQVVGGQDEPPTWLIDRDWRLFARPARELIPGGREIASFDLDDGSTLSASYDGARKSVYLPFSPPTASCTSATVAWKAR